MATTTANMALTVPGVGTEAGPTYATEINTSLGVIDLHDHTTGKGVRIPTAGINENATHEMNNNLISEIAGLVMQSISASAALINTIENVLGELNWRDASNNLVPITLAGKLVGNFANMVISGALAFAAANIITTSSNSYTVLSTDLLVGVNTATPAKTVTLPNPATSRRLIIVKDATGTANSFNVTISASGGSTINGAANVVISTAYGYRAFISNGTNWLVVAQA